MKGVVLDADSLGTDIDLVRLQQLPVEWSIHKAVAPSDTASIVSDTDIVLTNKVRLDRDILLKTNRLKLVSIMATGVNNVDLHTAAELGITVSNAVGYATPSVAQHTIAMMLNLATQQVVYLRDTQAGQWQRSNVFCRLDHPIVELSGKTLGIIGFGTLGSAVGHIAASLGMKVIAAVSQSNCDGTSSAIERVSLVDLLERSDIVSLHCPLTDSNVKLIGAKQLSQMKPSAFLVNTARGGLIDSEALIAALENRVIAGAAIDVLDSEPPSHDEPLLNVSYPNLLITPHNAWGARESRQRLILQMAENIERFISGNPIRCVV